MHHFYQEYLCQAHHPCWWSSSCVCSSWVVEWSDWRQLSPLLHQTIISSLAAACTSVLLMQYNLRSNQWWLGDISSEQLWTFSSNQVEAVFYSGFVFMLQVLFLIVIKSFPSFGKYFKHFNKKFPPEFFMNVWDFY